MLLRKWSTFIAVLLVTPMLALAQNTGKIAGTVMDQSSGQGLPGASVAVVGSTLGSITDIDGNYFIIGVPVGNYDVQASFVGYQTVTVEGVQVSTGYTKEVNFELAEGIELGEVVVEYERPLIQKDAVGAPKIVSGEEIVNLPVRGAAAVASIQAGVVSQEGSETLNIRGGRGSEVTYYIDGVKVIGSNTLPQSAIQEQEMIIGSISARYGDAMSGIINITTKSGSRDWFGSIEGVTSESLDDFGYNLASATFGGPIGTDKVNFFFAGEFLDQLDANPRAIEEIRVSDELLADLNSFPVAFRGTDMDGNDVLVPIPAGLQDGATLMADSLGVPDVSSGALVFSDGTTVSVPDGVTFGSAPRAVIRAEQLGPESFFTKKAKRVSENQNLSFSGNLTFTLFENGRFRVGGRYNTGEFQTLGAGFNRDGGSALRIPFAFNMARTAEREDYQVYGTWTQYLSQSTFYQLQGDFSRRFAETYDPRFGKGFEDFLEYGNIDNPEFATLRGYKNAVFADGVLSYVNTYKDGAGPATNDEVVATLVQVPGGRFNTYNKSENTQFRLNASATTQIGVNQLEFGAEYEQRTQRVWNISAASLARFVADASGPEQIPNDATDLDPNGYSSYGAIPAHALDNFVGYYGYDVRGMKEVNDEDLLAFIDQDITKPEEDYNIAPYQPIYYGGYVQDKVEFRDIVLNLGLRVDVFDNNTRVFKDRFARRPVCQAQHLGGTYTPTGSDTAIDCGAAPSGGVPGSIGSEFSVFYSGDDVIGYRDRNGGYYNSLGEPTNPGDIILGGSTRAGGQISPDMFKDYEPEVTLMPRIGVSFPVTDQALFFASYGIVSQRPSSRTFATLNAIQGTGGINNTALRPERTTKYELGFRQRVGARAAFTVSGFVHQIENLIQLREVRGASPSVFSSYDNVDFGTVKGIEFGFDLRRTNGISTTANYTLSFADGTGSGDATTNTIVWVDETPPNFISPLDFDQRHKVNISLDYRLGAGEGPLVFGANILENFGVNVLATSGSGFPFTPVIEPFNLAGAARATQPKGGINSDRMPWSSRIDLRVDRRFPLGSAGGGRGASITAFIWVQNLFDAVNTNDVWRFTGLSDTDGFLATPQGQRAVEQAAPAFETLYNHRNAVTSWVGIPRMTRLGVRVDF